MQRKAAHHHLCILIIIFSVLMFVLTSGCVHKSSLTGGDRGEVVKGLIGGDVSSLAFDNDGVLWMGFAYRGIGTYSNNQFKVYDRYNTPLPENGITTVYIDRYNRKWFGTGAGSVVRFDGRNWVTLPRPSEKERRVQNIRKILEMDDGLVWILAHDGGVFCYDQHDKVANHIPTFTDSRLESMSMGPDNNLWVGTWIEGIDVLDRKTNISANYNEGVLNNSSIWDMTYDPKQKKLFFMTGNGLHVYDGNYTVFTTENSGILYNRGDLVRIDREGNIWVGYDNQYSGVSKYDGKKWTHFNTGTPLERSWVFDIEFDDKNTAWFAVRDKGVVSFDGSTWKQLPVLEKDPRIWWRDKKLSELMDMEDVDVKNLSEAMKNPIELRGKKIRVSGKVESGFEYASIIDENGKNLGIWPDFNYKLYEIYKNLAHDVSLERAIVVDYYGFLEFGSYYGHLGGWPFQMYIVEMYPRNSTKGERDDIKKKVREYLSDFER